MCGDAARDNAGALHEGRLNGPDSLPGTCGSILQGQTGIPIKALHRVLIRARTTPVEKLCMVEKSYSVPWFLEL